MNIWKRYSMRVSKNWVKFNKMFTLSPWPRRRGELQREEERDLMVQGKPLGIADLDIHVVAHPIDINNAK